MTKRALAFLVAFATIAACGVKPAENRKAGFTDPGGGFVTPNGRTTGGGGGSGTVTQLTCGAGLTCSPSPVTSTGTITPNTLYTFGERKFGWWLPQGATTTMSTLGTPAPVAAGTATNRNPATTNLYASLQRVAYATAASSNTAAGLRDSAAQYWLGNGAGLGGFSMTFRCGIGDAVLNSTGHLFCGLMSATGAPTDAAPSTLTNILGIGCENSNAGAHLQAYGSGGVAQAATDLGANFPCDTTSTDIFDLQMVAPSNATTVTYTVTRVNTGATATGSWTGAQLPSNTTFLTPQMWRGTGANATASMVDVFSWYFETPN